ncbi:hypothetical protein CF386_08730 [Paraphotobacterium marinum]|uniref:Uncharacterized protein n=1 Tax=Paraphotobacterium marinum TaxID=1755811 RepID=A0A220VFH9_9GAMM|nr:hypothetical protein [Paraphotobacterium marinum]ASK79144.1 hypothetical protein CF386_08730 [Paraphotobacterium marinum]
MMKYLIALIFISTLTFASDHNIRDKWLAHETQQMGSACQSVSGSKEDAKQIALVKAKGNLAQKKGGFVTAQRKAKTLNNGYTHIENDIEISSEHFIRTKILKEHYDQSIRLYCVQIVQY